MGASETTPGIEGGVAPLFPGGANATDTVPAAGELDEPARPAVRTGRWDPRVMTVLTVLGFAIPVVGYLVLIGHYRVNAVVGDRWDDVSVIRQSYLHFPDCSSLSGRINSSASNWDSSVISRGRRSGLTSSSSVRII